MLRQVLTLKGDIQVSDLQRSLASLRQTLSGVCMQEKIYCEEYLLFDTKNNALLLSLKSIINSIIKEDEATLNRLGVHGKNMLDDEVP